MYLKNRYYIGFLSNDPEPSIQELDRISYFPTKEEIREYSIEVGNVTIIVQDLDTDDKSTFNPEHSFIDSTNLEGTSEYMGRVNTSVAKKAQYIGYSYLLINAITSYTLSSIG